MTDRAGPPPPPPPRDPLLTSTPRVPPPAPPVEGTPSGGIYRGRRRYAPWPRRAAAALIDAAIGLLFVLPGWLVIVFGPTRVTSCPDRFGTVGLCEVPTDATWQWGGLLIGIGAACYLTILSRMLGDGASIGRKALGYRVLDANTLQPIGPWRALERVLGMIVGGLALGIGLLWPLWDPENRALHDMLVQTRTVLDGSQHDGRRPGGRLASGR